MLATCICRNGSILDQFSCTIVNLFTCTFGRINMSVCLYVCLSVKNKIDKMDSKICFEMIFFVVEAIHERCANFIILTATVAEICGGQTHVFFVLVV